MAAYEIYGSPVVAVTSGTATTFCAISERASTWRIILPGITIFIEALYQRAAKLPKVEFVKPPQVICKTPSAVCRPGLYTAI